MAREVTGRGRQAPSIDVSGLFGRFRVPGSDFTLRFASTFANPTTPGHRELLSELKPMRERVDASALTDLTALLQRDLNDRRVARELIPYLLGTAQHATSRVGFFPAVLAILIPRGYLQQLREGEEGLPYPVATEGENAMVTYRQPGDSEFSWQVEQYSIDGTVQPVGLLSVNPRRCEIVVLDGQHRSNAFRYLAGDFDPSREIYAEFYRDVIRPEEFNADLPVTVVWFEAADPSLIEPRLISRQLFVDVNNSAHAVSRARTILLDDRSVSSLATQGFYNHAAQQGFEGGNFSLLHAAFDMDSDLVSAALPYFTLTTPEIVESSLQWLMLSSTNYSSLSAWRVDRMRAPRNRNQFVQVLGTLDNVQFGTDDDDNAVHIANPEHVEGYRRLMDSRVVPVLWQLFQNLPLLGAHYRAAAATEAWIEREGGPTVRDAWTKIFTGGEGLYWTFSDRQRVGRTNRYAQAIDSIEEVFRTQRARELDAEVSQTDQVFKSFATKAFQIGFVMAVVFLAEEGVGDGELVAAAELLMDRLAAYSPQNWLSFFRDVRPLVMTSDATPRLWPTYRNLLIRMYDEPSDEFFVVIDDLPETYAFRSQLKKLAGNLHETSADLPDQSALLRGVTTERDRIKGAFERTGLARRWFAEQASIDWGVAYLIEEFEKLD